MTMTDVYDRWAADDWRRERDEREMDGNQIRNEGNSVIERPISVGSEVVWSHQPPVYGAGVIHVRATVLGVRGSKVRISAPTVRGRRITMWVPRSEVERIAP